MTVKGTTRLGVKPNTGAGTSDGGHLSLVKLYVVKVVEFSTILTCIQVPPVAHYTHMMSGH